MEDGKLDPTSTNFTARLWLKLEYRFEFPRLTNRKVSETIVCIQQILIIYKNSKIAIVLTASAPALNMTFILHKSSNVQYVISLFLYSYKVMTF